jgi:hypothetical protein
MAPAYLADCLSTAKSPFGPVSHKIKVHQTGSNWITSDNA